MNDGGPEVISPLATLFALVFLGFLGFSIWTWVWFLKNLQAFSKWSWWYRGPNTATVGFIDLLGCFGCMVVAQVLAFGLGAAIWGGLSPSESVVSRDVITEDVEEVAIAGGTSETPAPEEGKQDAPMPPWVTPMLTVSMLFGAGLSLAIVKFRTQAGWPQLGLPMKEWSVDGALGWHAFLLFTPIVLVVSQIVVQSTKVEYEHPVLDTLRESPWTLPFLFLGAAVCAPIWEELVFRSFLIGWFDTLRLSRGNLKTILLGEKPLVDPSKAPAQSEFAISPPGMDSESNPALQSFGSSNMNVNPYRAQDVFGGTAQDTTQAPAVHAEPADEGLVAEPTAQPWWPAVMSGAIFGLAHFEYGVSWVPLVVFGVLLGRLFQLRRSVVPCIVVHALFNGLSLLGLAVQVLSKPH